ncbi:MAG: CDGSH iron-sulfur domain-containing protein, partial [Nitrosomonadaceae bacterium]
MTRWQKEPFAIDVKVGVTKAFCACGLSMNGPYCDGSHVITDKTPYVVKFEEDKTIYACGCQESSNRPYCDGSHKKLAVNS